MPASADFPSLAAATGEPETDAWSGWLALSGDDAIAACRRQHCRLQWEVARYIEELLRELGTMAKTAELGQLVYFLEMTRQEAEALSLRIQPGT